MKLTASKQGREAHLATAENQPGTVLSDTNSGEGYLKNTDESLKHSTAVFRFNKNGDLITAYPLVRKLKAPVSTQP